MAPGGEFGLFYFAVSIGSMFGFLICSFYAFGVHFRYLPQYLRHNIKFWGSPHGIRRFFLDFYTRHPIGTASEV